MRTHSWILALIAASALGCSKQPEPAGQAATPPPAGAASGQEPGAGGALDCATLASEVRQACSDRYAKGLQFDCDQYAATVSMYAAPRPGGTESDSEARARAEMCARMGAEFRQARDAATTTPTVPACVALGELLDERCFSQIGQLGYNSRRCDQWLSSSRQMTEHACANTQQMATQALRR